jgi:large subunit ribosomal protein L24
MASKIKKGDTVKVITGRSKGQRGKIIYIDNDKVKVEGVQMVKKTNKPNPQLQQPGGITEKEATIHISNIAILNPITQKADKVKFDLKNDGKKVRVFKSNNELVDIER